MADPVPWVCSSCGAVNRLDLARAADGARCGRCQAPVELGAVTTLDASRFIPFITRNDGLVVVDFWAPWCGPCRQFAPTYTAAGPQLAGVARLAKLDTEAEPGIAARFGIRSIPTLALFRSGQELARVSGALPMGELLRWVRSHAG